MKQAFTNGTNFALRQLIGIPGVSQTSGEIYQDGELLFVILPDPDMKWLKTADEQKALSPEDKTAYEEKDVAWAATPFELEMTEKQRDRIKAILSLVPAIAKLRQSPDMFKLYKAFGFTP